MNLYPKLYLNKATDVTIEILREHNIKALILDMDNTLLDFNENMIKNGEKWIKELKDNNIKLCIVSNSINKKKVEVLAKKIGIKDCISWGIKPLKFGIKKARKILNENAENIAVVGDQIFTDVLVANRSKMFSILVKPMNERDIWVTKAKRPLEKYIMRKYFSKIKTKEK